MALTDRELMILEQLTYLTEDVYKAAGIDIDNVDIKRVKGRTISEILSKFTENELITLSESEAEFKSLISGKEYADIIRYLKHKPELSNLVIKDTLSNETGVIAWAFENPSAPPAAIIAFKGTSGSKEWLDNVKGMVLSDTPSQKVALSFVEKLPYTDIAVVGHSKGGNKAMYVTALSDKVTRCVSLDGQGFSKAFYDKYWASLRAKAHLITNYAAASDFVNVLMYPIPGSKQVYLKAFFSEQMGDYHCPNIFIRVDEDGHMLMKDGTRLVREENGTITVKGDPEIVIAEQSESAKLLHNFSNYFMNNATAEERSQVAAYLTEIVNLTVKTAFGEPEKDDIIKLKNKIFEDTDSLSIILAYLLKFSDKYDVDEEEIIQILAEYIYLDNEQFELKDILYVFGGNAAKDVVIENLIDSDPDYISKAILATYLADEHGIPAQKAIELWDKTSERLRNIEDSKGIANMQLQPDRTYDFSVQTYQTLMDVIAKIEENALPSMDTWCNYQTESWFEALFINNAINAVHHYDARLSEINRLSRERIDVIFEDVRAIDGRYAGKLRESNARLRQINRDITELSRAIG